MSRIVVDASVAAKWFFPEEHSEAAAALLAGRRTLLAPDLIYAEFGNVVWKRVGRKEISAAEATQIASDFLRVPLEVTPSEDLLPAALELAVQTGRTVYDSLYVALAAAHGCLMVTGDQRLANSLRGGPFEANLRWVGSTP